MARLKVAILISGRGTNLQSLIEHCADPKFPAEIVLVLSNRPGAAGLDRAEKAGLTTGILDHKLFTDRGGFEEAMDGLIRAHGVDLICLAGFMRVLTPYFVERWKDRLINIHPSLLPAFPGLDTHARALAAGVRFAGCTVHYVRPDVDAGPIIVQAAVPVLPGDTVDTLAARVLEAEHRCYPLALRLIGEGRVKVTGDIVTIADAAAPADATINPLP